MVIRFTAITVIFSLAIIGGCATSRGLVQLEAPITKKTISENGKTIYIKSVIDKRIFEIKPAQPNIPSLDPDEQQNAEIKSRAIARKRNTFGKGLGDIILKEGQTVESIIHDSLEQAFAENGYSIIENESLITNDTYIVEAKIDKFWSWMNPGFWAITLSTEISTDVNVQMSGNIKNATIEIREFDKFQTTMGDNWVKVMQSALAAYVAEVKNQLK